MMHGQQNIKKPVCVCAAVQSAFSVILFTAKQITLSNETTHQRLFPVGLDLRRITHCCKANVPNSCR